MTHTWARENFARLETLYHAANGYLGVRAAPEEGAAAGVDSIRGTYINAFYEVKDVRYGEKLYGFPETQQVMVNLPDAQTIRFTAADIAFSMFAPEVTERRQTLDMENGLLRRTCRWQTKHGTLRVAVTRMVSFVQKGLFLLRYRVVSEDFAGSISLSAILNADVRNHAAAGDPRVAAEPHRCLAVREVGLESGQAYALAETLRSGLSVACRIAYQCALQPDFTKTQTATTACFSGALNPGESVELIQYAYYADSRRVHSPAMAARDGLAQCLTMGAEALQAAQTAYLRDFWQHARVTIDGDTRLQQAMDFNLYELLQSTGEDGVSNVAAKGLSGEGYEGHTFWDSEIYVVPFFLWTNPEKVRQMLLYRYQTLPRARENARLLGIAQGALYPWRTINGDECSAYFPAGSAQYHIDGDIAYAFLQYWDATGDVTFMAEYGAAVLVETARMWLQLGHMEADGFRIDCVTGPDEYTCLVNNNFYTNATAQHNLRGAVRVVNALAVQRKDVLLRRDTGLTDAELIAFAQAADRMYFPVDSALGISPQDDSFLLKQRLDLAAIPKERFPLLLHYHPLYLYRYQVCKQADTVLAHLLFPGTADVDTVRRSYAYYQQVTTHDSSLSRCVFAMMAARLHMPAEALQLFQETVALDVDDAHGNTRDGLHTANMGGAYLTILRGFAGIMLDGNGLSITPMLPPGWQGYGFPLRYRGAQLHCQVSAQGVWVRHLAGETVTMDILGQPVLLHAGETYRTGLDT